MRIFTVYLFAFLLTIAATSLLRAEMRADSLDRMRLDSEIEQFNDDTDQVMKCAHALDVFRSEFSKDNRNPYATVYLARAFDKIASTFGDCHPSDSLFNVYTDSAIKYYRLADEIKPGIQDRKFGFTMPVFIGHVFGGRCLWRLSQGDYTNARKELENAMNAGGFSPAQLEYCRLMLDCCDSNSILFTMGDEDTFPTLYLQMIQGYRTDLSVINTSLANMKWYVKLFLKKNSIRFAPVEISMTGKEIDSLDEVGNYIRNAPERLYTEVDIQARKRINKELGIEVADKAEICFPVYEEYGKHDYYALEAQRVIASILLANKWKRRIFFGGGGLQENLHCTHVPMREGIFVDELYPINRGQEEHFKKGDRWFHGEKMKMILLHDAQMDKFSVEQFRSIAQEEIYYALMEYFYIDSSKTSRREVVARIQKIPHKYLEGKEKTILDCAQSMYFGGFKTEAKKECSDIIPALQKKLSGTRTSIEAADINYSLALLLTGKCSEAIDFVNSFEISPEKKDQFLKEMYKSFDCK